VHERLPGVARNGAAPVNRLPDVRLRVARVAEVLRDLPADSITWLSASEQVRLARLRVPARRDQYLAGHWLVRSLLAAEGGTPFDWSLDERPGLPPAVQDHAGLQVSLSHSGLWIAAAVSAAPIGIDIEQRDPPRSALRHFEHLLLADDDTPGTLDDDALLQRWVIKEAWVKRHHGSALPDQLARLRIARCRLADADVRLYCSGALHLGIAAGSADIGEVEGCAPEAWRVTPS